MILKYLKIFENLHIKYYQSKIQLKFSISDKQYTYFNRFFFHCFLNFSSVREKNKIIYTHNTQWT